MNAVFLSLGGNLGNRAENLKQAMKHIKAIGSQFVKASSIYETNAWGSSSKKKYLNQVIQLKTHLSAIELLRQIGLIEKKMGRKRGSDQNADRVIDIDILFFNSDIQKTSELQIPHPRMHLRNFVLVPLNEIAPGFIHPVLKQPIRQLLKTSKDVLPVKIYKKENSFRYICVEGNIGSGKSTIANALARKLKADYLSEAFENNSFLPLFYSDPEAYSFHLEYSFFLSRSQQLLTYFNAPGKTLVTDFNIHKSLWFAKINLPKKEYLFFKRKVKPLIDNIPKPNLTIYLNSNLKNLKQNIRKRGRSYEKNISDSYLEAIAAEYDKSLQKWSQEEKFIIPIQKYTSKTEATILSIIENRLLEIF